MARKPSGAVVARIEPAKLTKSREEVRSQLLSRIENGTQIAALPIQSNDQLEEQKSTFKKWDDYNSELLNRSFSHDEYAKRYESDYAPIGMFYLGQSPTFGENVDRLRTQLNRKIEHLKSLLERLDLIDEVALDSSKSFSRLPISPPKPQVDGRKVFIVHGQDDSAKLVLARFLEKCDLIPIILHEQANNGQTIIEKFEQQADVGFAVVLLTPDDTGAAKPRDPDVAPQFQNRARQNVILELGYFLGRLGRARVAALKKGTLELPSDFLGVVWTDMDHTDAWKIGLARELKSSGYDIDLNTALN